MFKIFSVLITILAAGLAFGTEASKTTPPMPSILQDKVCGSLYGKCIGVVLGAPVEGWTKQSIQQNAQQVNAYPVTYYFPQNFNTDKTGFLYGNFNCYPANDDTALMMMGFIVLKEHGFGFTSRQLAETWLSHMSTGMTATAERVGMYNFGRGIWPPESASTGNPYSQWIGAQMRADIWGMINPGQPQIAAEHAQRDACITHTDEGIYGAQYIAAAISLAMVHHDVRSIVTGAVEVIPANSGYATTVGDVLAAYDRGYTWQTAWQMVDDRYGWNADGTRVGSFSDPNYNTGTGIYEWRNMRLVHAIPNGAACTLAVFYGGGDFSNSICLAVMCGYDADCNGGTVGGIVGAMIGEKAIPQNGRFH